MSSNLVFFLVGYILGISCRNNYNNIIIYLFIILLTLLAVLKKKKAIVIMVISFGFGFVYLPNIVPDLKSGQDFVGDCKVIDIHSKYQILQCDGNKYIIYDSIGRSEGDIFHVVGKIKELSTFDIPNVSTFKDYLYVHRVYYQIELSSWTSISYESTLRQDIIDYLCKDLSPDSLEMIKLLVLNDKTDSLELYDNLKSLSIIQLFVISGLHVNIVYSFLDKTIGRIIKNKIIIVILIFPYVWILNFSIPVLRGFLTLLIRNINKTYFHNYLDNMGCLCLVCISFLLYEPLYIYDYSFILTFLASFLLIFVQNIYYQKRVINVFISSAYIFVGLIPVICSISYEINILGYLLNILLSSPMSILFVFSLITAITKIPDFFYAYMVRLFYSFVELCNKIDTTIVFGKMNMLYCILFYFFYFSIIFYRESRQKKKCLTSILALSLVLLCSGSCNYLIDNSGVVFLDVGQGDATFIRGPNNSYNILIDTGGSIYSDYATQRLIPYFKAQGINSLDAVIITHDDYDHCGALDSLNANFSIDTIYYGYNYDSFNINGFIIQNLNRYIEDDSEENESSAVLLFEQNDIRYLVMGDAPISIEEKILSDNNNLDVDVLRIGHHGSKTSTSDNLLISTTPNVAIISVGDHNSYRLPNREVLDSLDKYDITYRRTDIEGTIEYKKANTLNLLLSNSG